MIASNYEQVEIAKFNSCALSCSRRARRLKASARNMPRFGFWVAFILQNKDIISWSGTS